jgi:hypothetical protein
MSRGKDFTMVDTLSRAPSAKPDLADEEFEKETTCYVSAILSYIPATEKRIA